MCVCPLPEKGEPWFEAWLQATEGRYGTRLGQGAVLVSSKLSQCLLYKNLFTINPINDIYKHTKISFVQMGEECHTMEKHCRYFARRATHYVAWVGPDQVSENSKQTCSRGETRQLARKTLKDCGRKIKVCGASAWMPGLECPQTNFPSQDVDSQMWWCFDPIYPWTCLLPRPMVPSCQGWVRKDSSDLSDPPGRLLREKPGFPDGRPSLLPRSPGCGGHLSKAIR